MIMLMSMTTPLTVICRVSSNFIVDQGHEPSWDRMLTEIKTVMVMSLLSVTMTNENSLLVTLSPVELTLLISIVNHHETGCDCD